ncbi:hypothetical protein H6P81_000189 [Aristolochia fimbriata]|uniref:RNase III domain-containing protein n=1 Tax=Aristolochia fimbriata TaxID=158543 RepID=A0AAV7F6D3_ARIFI|nr:hypothetical protein H6P81_000189 [Aristolochia fimbriata]
MAASTAASLGMLRLTVSASWKVDSSPIPVVVNPKPSKKKDKNSNTKLASPQKKTLVAVSDQLTRSQGATEEELYLGYERWLPVAPQVKSPRSIYNAATLAYVGDSVYELYARRHFLFPPLSMDEYNDRVMEVVRCEAQDALLKKLLDDEFLSEEERDILRWGKNIGSGKTRTIKRAGVAVYNRASSLETLIGYLYLTDMERLEELMQKMGFSPGASNTKIMEQFSYKQQWPTPLP